MPDLDILEVRLQGDPAGTLTRLGRDRIVFGFDNGYLDDTERPTLGLSFRDAFGGVATDIEPTRVHAPPFFSNLLPEGSLREYLARSAGIDPRLEFPLLGALGEDLPGAVSIAPPAGGGGVSRASAGGGTQRSGRSAGRGTPDSVVRPLFGTRAPTPRPQAPLRFSLAGTQLKVPAVMAGGRLEVPPHGVGGTWIVKFAVAGVPGTAGAGARDDVAGGVVRDRRGRDAAGAGRGNRGTAARDGRGRGAFAGGETLRPAGRRAARPHRGLRADPRSAAEGEIRGRDLPEAGGDHRPGVRACRCGRIRPPPGLLRPDRKRRCAPQELVGALPRRAGSQTRARLRPGVHDSVCAPMAAAWRWNG